MSDEDVETFRRVVAAFNRGGDPQAQELFDPEGPQARELFDPEVRIEPLLAGGVEGAVYRGRAGAVEFVSQLNEPIHRDHGHSKATASSTPRAFPFRDVSWAGTAS